jgi:steroid delta-isomerase-like uncharacterized protein
MSLERNKEIVRQIFDEYVNHGKPELLSKLFAEDYVGAQSGTPPMGRDGFAKSAQALREGFPDIHYSIVDLMAEGDRVTARWQWRGTHSGVFRGPAGTFPPTGKSILNEGIGIFQVKDGKVTHAWLITDRLGFLQQVGGMPTPTAAKSGS